MSEELPPLLTPDRIRYIKKSDSKKRVFEILAELLASGQKNITQNEIFDALTAREKIGNTVVGNGAAIPRARVDITRPKSALVFLKKGIKLDAPDKKVTHLFLAFLFPEKDSEKYANFLKKVNLELATQPLVEGISESKNPQILLNYFDKLFNTELELGEAS